jgi:hypothetical protein
MEQNRDGHENNEHSEEFYFHPNYYPYPYASDPGGYDGGFSN